MTSHLQLGRTTLSKFLIQQLHDLEDHGQLAGLLIDVAAAIKAIAALTAKGPLGGYWGAPPGAVAHGDGQRKLNVLAHEEFIRNCEWGGLVAGMVSEQMTQPHPIPPEYPRGRYLLLFDPLDGTSNVDLNVPIGTIFSVIRHGTETLPASPDFLRPGSDQVAAGYAIYGPATLLVLTVGKGTHAFTLDREIGNFILTHPDLRIPEETSEFAINSGNERFWEPPVQRYVRECRAGQTDIRGRDFTMRWLASTVADVHRILIRGGVFLHPRDLKDPSMPGRLRLIHEANPIAFVVEQAGGLASTGRGRLLDVQPLALDQRVPVILGSRDEVQRLEKYHQEFDDGTDEPYESPLFRERSLFRDPVAGSRG